MLIKITAINKNETLGREGQYEATMITGERIDGKGEWSKKFFSNNQTLMSELEEFGVGETVNVRLTAGKGTNKHGGKNWNIAGFEEASADLVASVQGDSNPTSGSGTAGPSQVVASTKKSTWGGRTGDQYDRSAALYLSFDMIKTNTTEAILRKLNDDKIATRTIRLAERLNDYIHNDETGIDALEPPVID